MRFGGRPTKVMDESARRITHGSLTSLGDTKVGPSAPVPPFAEAPTPLVGDAKP